VGQELLTRNGILTRQRLGPRVYGRPEVGGRGLGEAWPEKRPRLFDCDLLASAAASCCPRLPPTGKNGQYVPLIRLAYVAIAFFGTASECPPLAATPANGPRSFLAQIGSRSRAKAAPLATERLPHLARPFKTYLGWPLQLRPPAAPFVHKQRLSTKAFRQSASRLL